MENDNKNETPKFTAQNSPFRLAALKAQLKEQGITIDLLKRPLMQPVRCIACQEAERALTEFVNTYRRSHPTDDHLNGILMTVAIEEMMNDPDLGNGSIERVASIVGHELQRYATFKMLIDAEFAEKTKGNAA